MKHEDNTKNYHNGEAGKAWEYDIPKMTAKYKEDPAEQALIGAWVIYAPHAHPMWAYYRLMLMHLRPTKISPTPTIYLPGATHEFILHALDPDHKPNKTDIPNYRLAPANFGAQLVCKDDKEAHDLIEKQAILPIVHGLLSPDSDYISQWAQIFGDNMLRK